MKPDNLSPDAKSSRGSRWLWVLAAGCVLVLILPLLLKTRVGAGRQPEDSSESLATANTSSKATRAKARHVSSLDIPATSAAEQNVTNKVAQFARSRRELVRAIAKKFRLDVPPQLESFFDRAETGNWDEIQAAYKTLQSQRKGKDIAQSLGVLWPAVNETYGVAEVAHNWPAQKLLDYGNAILDSLRPGMIYAGGTDSGRYVPTLLNETSDGEHHIVVTQNALADATYLQYLNFQYGDRFAALSHEDSQSAFNGYLADAQKRLLHDEQFPNEPKQVRPGEDIRMNENRVQVSGQVAVMAINEKLFQMFMDKNPTATFAMEQSFSFGTTYANATPLGPIMELRSQDGQNALTSERATQSVDYWRSTSQQLLSDPAAPDGSDPRKAYAKLVSEQAALLLDHKYSVQAEQAFQIAIEIMPSNSETVLRYVDMLVKQKRFNDAIGVANDAVTAAPDNKVFGELLSSLKNANKN